MATKPALTQTKSELFFPVHRSFSLNGQPQSSVRMPSAPTPCFPHDPALNASSVLCPETQMWLNTKYRYGALGPMLRRCAYAVPNRLPPPVLPTFFSLQLSLEFLLAKSESLPVLPESESESSPSVWKTLVKSGIFEEKEAGRNNHVAKCICVVCVRNTPRVCGKRKHSAGVTKSDTVGSQFMTLGIMRAVGSGDEEREQAAGGASVSDDDMRRCVVTTSPGSQAGTVFYADAGFASRLIRDADSTQFYQ
ncbi:hypothetical protein C8R45DRAFT_1134713 [Mycena sanguinolenta]|nr:hypothetical protein C8R45DRAFT_1134713 [Mycena sanguinolenta]